MSKTKIKPKYLRRDDAAIQYGFTPRQFRRWTEKGWIPICRPAGDTGPAYVEVAALERFLNQRTTQGSNA